MSCLSIFIYGSNPAGMLHIYAFFLHLFCVYIYIYIYMLLHAK